jgi:hypothetical protein
MRFWASFFDDFMVPARALLVATGGVFIALMWFAGSYLLAVGIVVAGAGLGWSAAFLGDRLLPDRPVVALELLEFSVLAPGTIGAMGAAIVTVVGVELSMNEPPELKAAAGALGTGITSFITVMFVSWAGDKNDSNLAAFIQRVFRSHYGRAVPGAKRSARIRYFGAESDGERWVYSDEFKGVMGWGRAARRKRAQGLAIELRTADEAGQ